MSEPKISFADSEAYDRAMGRMSRIAGEKFLDWLSLPNGLQWLDIGCGAGSFSELVLARNAPSSITAIDPSAEQIAYAQNKPSASFINYRSGDAMALSFGNDEYDVAVMALVIQHIPDPDQAMAEMLRVVRPTGAIAAYIWPGYADGHPYGPLDEAVRLFGGSRTGRPGTQIRTIEGLANVFRNAGLKNVDTCSLELALEFDSFHDYWSAHQPSLYGDLSSSDVTRLMTLLRERLPTDENGRIAYPARANAVRGQVPG